jgi:fructose-bisphosphate aldolase class I
MAKYELESVARALVAPGKGILAADESSGTIEKRFKSIGTESTEDNRRAYRDMLFTTKGTSDFISGVILYDETIRQKSLGGTLFPEVLQKQGIIPGIKVDTGAKALAGFPGEKITEGLDGLAERLKEYRDLGAKFAKWRAVITIGDGIPSQFCIDANAHGLARYAALCQEAGIVPIVEPEVLMDGGHTIERCDEVTRATLESVFYALYEHRVVLEGILLKPNMVLSGKECPKQANVQQVAEATVRCFRRSVPAAVPGIVFLSGGQSDEVATAHLDAMNKMGKHPWELSFSYGRALQAPALAAWKGQKANFEAGQKAYYHRAKCNGAARYGKYSEKMEREPAYA